MALKPSNKRDPNFSMSSLTDIIFLLLIFFMLTSTFVTPNALNLTLPSSNSKSTAKPKVSVSITKSMEYYVNADRVTFDNLEQKLGELLKDEEDPTVFLNAEKSVSIEKVVEIMNIANSMKIKMVLSTNPLDE
ncbi:MAG: ExbD/TolR family protein [Chitinophagales bacterium]